MKAPARLLRGAGQIVCRWHGRRRRRSAGDNGFSLLELLLVVAVMATLVGVSVPLVSGAIDELRAASAARHAAARVAAVRIEAVRRSSTVALRFVPAGADYTFTPVLDGNGNGIRASEIASGVDRVIGRTERLADFVGETAFGLLPGVPDLNGATGNPDGVRLGSTSILSMSPNGSCTGGTLYVHGRRSQFAVRLLGATGRARFFRYDMGTRRWVTR